MTSIFEMAGRWLEKKTTCLERRRIASALITEKAAVDVGVVECLSSRFLACMGTGADQVNDSVLTSAMIDAGKETTKVLIARTLKDAHSVAQLKANSNERI